MHIKINQLMAGIKESVIMALEWAFAGGILTFYFTGFDLKAIAVGVFLALVLFIILWRLLIPKMKPMPVCPHCGERKEISWLGGILLERMSVEQSNKKCLFPINVAKDRYKCGGCGKSFSILS